ncbi:MAG TPA: hypothetical protein VNY05_14845 [Candidatus Acidoferrales bacterium]|jgi:hypothetical protein|nr:hypothetical protein [Candidatus Acidoferrales bacterium]
MQSPCDPPKFDEQDWSQFDFSRWHLDGVQLDATAAAIADLTQQLFQSDEWTGNFRTTLPEFQKQALSYYQEGLKELQEEKTVTAREFDDRLAAARQQSASLLRVNEAAAAPLVFQAVPGAYHVVVKVTDAGGLLGLPGMTAQLMDPRTPEVPLVQAVTDAAGNAVLAVTAETAKEMNTLHAALRVVDLNGKVLQKIAGATCIRLNQTETKVVPLADAPEIASNKTAALAERSRREAYAQRVNAKVDLLQQERDDRLRELDCKLQQNQAIIDSIQSPTGTTGAAGQPAASAQPAPPVAETPPVTPPATGTQPPGKAKTPTATRAMDAPPEKKEPPRRPQKRKEGK